MTPEWLRPEWRIAHPKYWVPCADPRVTWFHPLDPTGLDPDGTLTRCTPHYFTLDSIPHRLDGPTLLDLSRGYEFRVNGRFHRLDGPAWNDRDTQVEFWVNGNRHRMDGPAVIILGYAAEWWVNGIRLPDNPTDLDILGALL